jgi:cytoskeletal protein RodZ
MEAMTMSQISPPLRILLIGSVVFVAAWFAFLRPGGETAPTPSTSTSTSTVPAKDPSQTASSSVGRAVQKAETAKAQTEAAAAASAGQTTPSATTGGAVAQAPAGKPATAAPGSKDAEAAQASLPLSVAKAMASKKILAVLFWNPKAADDKAVRRALKGIDRHHGKVVVHVANVAQVARYAAITRGVDVQQSPSVVVVDRKLQGDLLTGYVDRPTIEQAVSDALRAG